ncbi:transcription factor IBH1-like isoform X2 [Rhodamnia argentea]|nr:transcription factor IBH1-like isoform X2 [Rhodamnia argentea]
MKNPQRSPTNPGSVRSRFTQVFLQSLLRIRKHSPASSSSSSSLGEFLKRCHRVKVAAYVSMARAAGTRRAWSRAMLWRVRHDAHRHRLLQGRCSRSSSRERSPGKKKRRTKKKKKRRDDQEHGFGNAEKLQKLVPGGEAMDFSCLLDETAHYIKCLVTQVKVMRSIADFYSL